MPRRRRQPPPRAAAKSTASPFYAPFETLGKLVGPNSVAVRERPAAPLRTAPTGQSPPPSLRADGPAAAPFGEEAAAAAFAAAMADVRPLRADTRVDAPAPATLTVRTTVDEDAEAFGALVELVNGSGDFDISDSTEYVEGAVVGFDARILKRLRRGELAYQDMIDLHGMSAATARGEVERFVTRAVAEGKRVVLIVHGRGRNSKDNVPVLKERLKSWLARGRIGRSTLAFTSARPADGGTGALYVLLRRCRGPKEPITVLEGAKRE